MQADDQLLTFGLAIRGPEFSSWNATLHDIRFTRYGGRPTIGIDVVTSTGGDMFAQMKFMLQAERSRINERILAGGHMPEKLSLSAKEVLEFATIDGARALGLESKVGSLTPGKQTDIILIRATDINLTPVNDPIGAVVQCAHAGNVDSVYVAGKTVKGGGRLFHVDLARIRPLAAQSLDYIFSQYGTPDGAWSLSKRGRCVHPRRCQVQVMRGKCREDTFHNLSYCFALHPSFEQGRDFSCKRRDFAGQCRYICLN
jgi:hypothetical protein